MRHARKPLPAFTLIYGTGRSSRSLMADNLDQAARLPRQLWTSRWVRWIGTGLALSSGLSALAILLLPLLLVLLMMLFDTTAHGVVVLLDVLFSWLRAFMPGSAGGSSPFWTVAFHPAQVAVTSLAQALPCLGGLLLILLRREPGRSWWWVVLLWGLSAGMDGEVVASLLLPGIVVAASLAVVYEAEGRRSRRNARL